MEKELKIEYLVSYLTGDCSIYEQELVENWISMSNDNLLMFEDFKQVWDHSSINNSDCKFDIDKSWDNFKLKTNFDKELRIKKTSIRFSRKNIVSYALRIAAVLIVSFGTYFLFINEDSIETINYSSVVDQQKSQVVLPDGSRVTVKSDVEMDYPEQFSSDIRELNFKGEAFFEVVSNPNNPMVIALDNIRVKVLGTSFSLSNCPNSDEITIYLESGKVEFYSVDNIDGSVLEQIDLLPGQKGIYNKSSGLISMHEFSDNNHLAWKTGTLEFVKTPLQDVIEVIEHTYNVKVVNKANLENYLLTARFDNETPESIFESIQVVYGFNCKIEGNVISIY